MKKVLSYPLFLYLQPIFFYLFGISSFGLHATFSRVLIPFAGTMMLSFAFHIFLHWKYKQEQTPYIVLFLYYFSYLFFGNIKDAIPVKNIFYSYYFLFPTLFMLPLLIGFILKRKNKVKEEVFTYLNYLMIILCIVQFTISIRNINIALKSYVSPIKFSSVSTSQKPSIYFVLFDEYPGQISLKAMYNFDNTKLLTHLRSKQFYVFDTINSNYDKTVYSINSTFNLNYVDQNLYMPVANYQTYLKNFAAIKANLLMTFLKRETYSINNLSLFDIANQDAPYYVTTMKTSYREIFRNIFHFRIINDLVWKLYVGKTRIEWFYNKYLLNTHHQNNQIIERTLQESSKNHQKPVFHFAHLLLPHDPYFTDSTGNLYDMEFESQEGDILPKGLDYIKYANLRMMQIADTILKNDPQSIIILLSDHSYRETPVEYRKFNCNNFMAIHLPDTNYGPIKKMRTNVNLFRIILNQYFNQNLPLLKDSCYFVDEDKNCFTPLAPF